MKRLYRSRKDRMIAGVCGGIAEYFNIDPVLVRVIAVVLTLWGGSGVLAYIIAVIVIPQAPDTRGDKKEEPSKAAVPPPKKTSSRQPSSDTGALIVGIILVVLGLVFLMKNVPFFNDFYWWFRHQIGHIFWPSVLIVIGAFIIIKGTRKE